MKLPFIPVPKRGKRPKKIPKPMARSRIKPGKVRFIDYDSPKRQRRLTDACVHSLALKAQTERLQNPTPEELAMEQILRRNRLAYKREVIIQNGDRFLLLDFVLTGYNLVIECDGSQHRLNRDYDAKRSMFLARRGYKVARFWNAECLNGKAEERLLQMLRL